MLDEEIYSIMKRGEGLDSDGFISVTHKRKKKGKTKRLVGPSLIGSSSTPTYEEADAFKKSKIDSIQKDLMCSEFISAFKELLNSVLTSHQQNGIISHLNENIDDLSNNPDEIDIVCYGLGHFTTCMIARYQLAFLMILREVLQPQMVCLYDPQFSQEEKYILEHIGLDVLIVNEEGKRTINRKTIFFMPHCDFFLYNNLLGANWKEDSLSKLIIIGNSFQIYFLTYLESKLKIHAKYLYFSKEIVTEEKICNNFQFTDVFNDLSVHYFHLKDLSEFQKWDISDVTVKKIE